MKKGLPKSINLLEPINSPTDAFSKLYEWVFKVGRYLLVFVEIGVIGVFVARFIMDGMNNDLKKQVNDKVKILSQTEFRTNEIRYRNLQKLFTDIDTLDQGNGQKINSQEISAILDSIPRNIKLENFSYNDSRVSSTFSASSFEDVKSYEAFLKQNTKYSDVKLNLEKTGDSQSDITFSVTYQIIQGS